MRNTPLIVLTIALICAFTFTVTGQEEALPPVKPRLAVLQESDPSSPYDNVVLDLAVEPLSGFREPTLAEAAEQNDYATFDALYRAGGTRGESSAAFETLHEVWTFAITDPIGAFYGPDMHARLSRAYPDYAAFIEPYQVVDDNGNVFYPTSETRAFLLEQARAGRRSTTRIQVAERRTPAAPPRRTETATAVSAAAGSATVPQPVSTEPATAQAEVPASAPAIAAVPEPVRAATPDVVPVRPATAPTRDGSRGLLMLVTGLLALALIGVIFRLQRAPTRAA